MIGCTILRAFGRRHDRRDRFKGHFVYHVIVVEYLDYVHVLTERPRCAALSWGEDLVQFSTQFGSFDVILGADVVFWPSACDPLFQTVAHLLKPEVNDILLSNIDHKELWLKGDFFVAEINTNWQGRIQDFWKGGVQARIQDFSQAPPPLDIVRVTSSDLRKFEKHPHSWTFTKGGGPTLGPMLKSLHRGPKGGGPDPLDPPPWIRHWLVYLLYSYELVHVIVQMEKAIKIVFIFFWYLNFHNGLLEHYTVTSHSVNLLSSWQLWRGGTNLSTQKIIGNLKLDDYFSIKS